MPTQTMPLAVGRGIDRATGLVAVHPDSPIDVRNVWARDAKMALRPGMAETGFPPLSWGTDILAIVGVKATLDVLFAVYDRDSREIRIYRLDTEDNVLQTLSTPANGLWGVVLGSDFPVVSAAESNGLVFFAHDEADFNSRLATIYYTPNFATPATPGTLTTLTADLDGDGASAPVYFRGVFTYLVFMTAWGYGSEADPDRGDIYRLSLPGDPLTWNPPNYVLCGVRKDPIVGSIQTTGQMSAVTPNTTVLAISKTDECYRLVGSSFDDFGIELLDPRYGSVSSRVLINVGGMAYTWSSDGARMITPSGTIPIAQPLELISPLPADFPALGPERLAFVSYDKSRYLLEWLFPDLEAARVPVPSFALSLWDPKDPRWTLFERQQPVSCTGLLLFRDTGTEPLPPAGYPAGIDAEDRP